MEKCYRDIQNKGFIAGLSLLEVFILLAVCLVLFPIFTLLDINIGIIFILALVLFFVFRLANRLSVFDYGLLSFIYSKFVWPHRLSAFVIDEHPYLKDENEPLQLKSNQRQSG